MSCLEQYRLQLTKQRLLSHQTMWKRRSCLPFPHKKLVKEVVSSWEQTSGRVICQIHRVLSGRRFLRWRD